jgi:hypothetical protein
MHLLIVSSLLAATGLAGYTLHRDVPPTLTVQPLALRVAPVPDAEFLPDDPAWWWPEELGAAAGMFQCQPAVVARSARNKPAESVARTATPTQTLPVPSMIVWADKANRVIAFGSTVGTAPLPSYAAALHSASEKLPAHRPIHAATPGHVLRITTKKIALRLQGIELACVRTWDD